MTQQRVLTISTLCLLNGQRYESRDYVLGELARVPSGTDLIVLPHMPFLTVGASAYSSR